MKLPATDPYKTLGILVTATADEIKKRYRSLAMQYHPDRNPGNKEAEDKFKLVAEAYDWLTDPDKKALIDRSRKTSTGAGDKINMEDLFAQFGDIFSGNGFKDFFDQPKPKKPESWAERMARHKQHCPTCNGAGKILVKVMGTNGGVTGFKKIPCPTCT